MEDRSKVVISFSSKMSPAAAQAVRVKSQMRHSSAAGRKMAPVARSPNAPTPDLSSFTLLCTLPIASLSALPTTGTKALTIKRTVLAPAPSAAEDTTVCIVSRPEKTVIQKVRIHFTVLLNKSHRPPRFIAGDTADTTENARKIFSRGTSTVEAITEITLPAPSIIRLYDPAETVCPPAIMIPVRIGMLASRNPAAPLMTNATFSMHVTIG